MNSRTSRIAVIGLVVAIIGVVVTVASLVLPAPNYIGWGGALCLGLLPVAGGIALSLSLYSRHGPGDLPETTTFRPLKKLDTETAWRRPADVKRVIAIVKEKRETLPVVVGASGAGKSVLLDVWVTDAFEKKGYEVETVLTYQGDGDYIKRKLDKRRGATKHLVLILDQFEQWLAKLRSKSPEDHVALQKWLKALLEEAQSADNYTVLLSIRAEWYYDLHFLTTMLPPLSSTAIIEGASPDDRTDEFRESILDAFEEEVDDKAIAEGILKRLGRTGQLSPLEAQFVGATVELRRKHHESISLQRFDKAGGVAGAVDTFLTAVLDRTDDPSICLKVLCAFSIQTRFRRQLTGEDLEKVLFEDQNAVKKAVNDLKNAGLLRERPSDQLDLAHDYLADYFRRKSGNRLNAIERDNLFVHVQELDSTATKEPDDRKGQPRLGLWVRWALVALLTIRLLDFGFRWTISGPSFRTPVFGTVLDVAFIPFFVSALGWNLYVTMMYDGIFRSVDKSSVDRFFSLLVLLNLLLATGVGILWPSGWLLAITWGGVPVTMRLAALAYRKGLNGTARRHLLLAASFALSLALLIGLLFAAQLFLSTHVIHGAAEKNRWLAVNAVLGMFMFIASRALAPMHVSRSGVSQIRGLMARPKSAKVMISELW